MERLLDEMTALMVNLTCTKGKIRMNIQMGCTGEIARQVLDDLELPFGSVTYEIMDEDIILNLTITEGGTEA